MISLVRRAGAGVHPNPVNRRACRVPNGDVTTLRAGVLVEGNSDRVALHNLAERRGRDLGLEGIEFVTWAGSPTRGHSRRDTGRTGSASAVPVRSASCAELAGPLPTVDQA